MSRVHNDYFGLNKWVSAILALFFGFIFSPITRILDRNIFAGILRIVLVFLGIGLIFNIIDAILILINGNIFRMINL
ncbi:MAG: hypothetical protein K6G48_04340 [Acholeplasmatales bacterium]|nr:hypothetical protein [Acholeplasmatales bacterium]